MADIKTVTDVRRMLQGITEEETPSPAKKTPASLPEDAVSATIETVEEKPLQTTETVEYVDDGTRTVVGPDESKAKAKK